MLIGGLALPAYGQIRATQDVDIAIRASFEDSAKIQSNFRQEGFLLPSSAQPEAPLFLVTDLKRMVEVEIWTRPDGVFFDQELLKRRWKVRPFSDDPSFEMYVIGPEDFIVNKLARSDRRVLDEGDAASVLARMKGKLDYQYLERRAKAAKVSEILEQIAERVTQTQERND